MPSKIRDASVTDVFEPCVFFSSRIEIPDGCAVELRIAEEVVGGLFAEEEREGGDGKDRRGRCNPDPPPAPLPHTSIIRAALLFLRNNSGTHPGHLPPSYQGRCPWDMDDIELRTDDGTGAKTNRRPDRAQSLRAVLPGALPLAKEPLPLRGQVVPRAVLAACNVASMTGGAGGGIGRISPRCRSFQAIARR